MIIKCLVENNSISDEYKSEYGLSLYIETKEHKLLFDVGQSEMFLENAKKLGINISEIDTVVISHAHSDHGGGLRAFMRENSTAAIYIRKNAFEKYYSQRPGGNTAYIGLDEELKDSGRFIFTGDYLAIDAELELFSNICGKELASQCNKVLLMEHDGRKLEDTFSHEQNLIVNEEGKLLLVAGCAHNGIVNIVNQAVEMKKRQMSFIIGGFHLYNFNEKKSEDAALITQIGEYLNQTGAKCYTGHCTGLEPFEQLKNVMKDNIMYLATGSVVKL